MKDFSKTKLEKPIVEDYYRAQTAPVVKK